jgi:predicted nucleic-acid-binding Zn-ribbon protein
MAGFMSRLKAGVAGTKAALGPQGYAVEGRQVTCPHCGGQEFVEGSAMLNTAGMTFLELDWANKSAYTLMCAECSRIEWFGQAPERL